MPNGIKRGLLQHSNFACSICGGIPVVFHHIEEWAKNFSDDKKYLIPICDACHRSIHGAGGSIYTKKELKNWKANPVKPAFLKYRYSLERKRGYSFFIGSNFVANGEKTSLFNNGLMTIDTSSGSLKLSVLAGIEDGKPSYLIQNNELMIDTNEIWYMEFSVPTLKIWKMAHGKRTVLIDLVINPDVIILREMHTNFDGQQLNVYKRPQPKKQDLQKITQWVQECEQYYREMSAQINRQPTIPKAWGIDIDKQIKKLRKDNLKLNLERALVDKISKDLKWEYVNTTDVLRKVLSKSIIFRQENNTRMCTPEELALRKRVSAVKKKYKKEFNALDDVIVEYGSMIMSGNMVL